MLILGAGGYARQVYFLLEEDLPRSGLAFFDDAAVDAASLPPETQLLPAEEAVQDWFARHGPRMVLGVGNPAQRRGLTERFERLGGELLTLQHSRAMVGHWDVHLGDGGNLHPGVVVEVGVRMGRGVLLNTGSMLHHACQLGDFCALAPGAVLLGEVRLGAEVFVGANATILPGIRVGEGAVIAAGAVVREDVAAGSRMAGVPARPM